MKNSKILNWHLSWPIFGSPECESPYCLFSLSPYLTSSPSSFFLSVICQAAQFLAFSPPAQDSLDFSPAKELCTVPQLSSVSLFLFLSLYPTPLLFLPHLFSVLISASPSIFCVIEIISVYFVSLRNPLVCRQFICRLQSLNTLDYVMLAYEPFLAVHQVFILNRKLHILSFILPIPVFC